MTVTIGLKGIKKYPPTATYRFKNEIGQPGTTLDEHASGLEEIRLCG
jgi:hypothetical protein